MTQTILLFSLVFIISFCDMYSFQILRNQPHSTLVPEFGGTSLGSSAGNLRLCAEEESNTRGKNGKTKFGVSTDVNDRFLSEFKTADGTSINPYTMLKLSRSATSAEIKQSYRRLSRQLHPDMVAQNDILPGRCATLDDVRDEWEKVKLAYEILSDPKTRQSYDRNSAAAEMLKDPGGAVGRAVMGGAMSGIGLVLGGAWRLGEMATKKVYETAVAEKKEKGGSNKRGMTSPALVANALTDAITRECDSEILDAKSKGRTITPGTQGSVRYNNNHLQSSPIHVGPTSKDATIGDQSSMPVSRIPKETFAYHIPMPMTVVDVTATMTATASIDVSNIDASTSNESKSVRMKDAGFVDMNNMALLTPGPVSPPILGRTKKERKMTKKREKKASAKLD